VDRPCQDGDWRRRRRGPNGAASVAPHDPSELGPHARARHQPTRSHGQGPSIGARRARAVNVEHHKLSEHSPARAEPGPVSESLLEYARLVLSHWPWLLAGLIGAVLGLYSITVSHVLAIRSWIWFGTAFGAVSVAQFLAFHAVRKQRNSVLTLPLGDRVSVFAVAASRGEVPPPVVAPLEYQLRALRQALAFFRSIGEAQIDVQSLDSALKRVERDGVLLAFEPLGVHDCHDGLRHLVAIGELIEVPERRGFAYRFPPHVLRG
jgi:hypothetical protein